MKISYRIISTSFHVIIRNIICQTDIIYCCYLPNSTLHTCIELKKVILFNNTTKSNLIQFRFYYLRLKIIFNTLVTSPFNLFQIKTSLNLKKSKSSFLYELFIKVFVERKLSSHDCVKKTILTSLLLVHVFVL